MSAVAVRGFFLVTFMTMGVCHATGLGAEDAVDATQTRPPSAVAEGASGSAPEASSDPAAKPLDGTDVYASKCQFCHGPNMVTPGGATFDLRKFPLDDRRRFETSILKGKNAMPAWQGIITPAEIDALWAYLQTRGR